MDLELSKIIKEIQSIGNFAKEIGYDLRVHDAITRAKDIFLILLWDSKDVAIYEKNNYGGTIMFFTYMLEIIRDYTDTQEFSAYLGITNSMKNLIDLLLNFRNSPFGLTPANTIHSIITLGDLDSLSEGKSHNLLQFKRALTSQEYAFYRTAVMQMQKQVRQNLRDIIKFSEMLSDLHGYTKWMDDRLKPLGIPNTRLMFESLADDIQRIMTSPAYEFYLANKIPE